VIRARLFGHRGVAARAPENTLAGFRLAREEGAHGIEFDIRATGDNALVVLHDPTVDRTTSGRGILRDLTLEEVRAFDAGASFDPQFQGERIPTLDELLDEFLGKIALDIEVKEILPQDALRALAARIAASPDAEVFASSFFRDVLQQLHSLAPDLPRGLLLLPRAVLPTEAFATSLGLSSILAHHSSIDEPFAEECRRLGLPLRAYTVNSPERARELDTLGVDVLISDDPRAISS
jgi:glycerophosphoryl diester phosphodiesterase